MIWILRPENFEDIRLASFDIKLYCGFVYKITRKSDGKFYIGQKTFHSKVTKPPLKGKKLKRRSIVESDWKKYWGSNEELKAEVIALGEQAFDREMLRLCKTKSELNYYELKEQMACDALLRDDSYNGYVGGRITRSMIKSWNDPRRIRKPTR